MWNIFLLQNIIINTPYHIWITWTTKSSNYIAILNLNHKQKMYLKKSKQKYYIMFNFSIKYIFFKMYIILHTQTHIIHTKFCTLFSFVCINKIRECVSEWVILCVCSTNPKTSIILRSFVCLLNIIQHEKEIFTHRYSWQINLCENIVF